MGQLQSLLASIPMACVERVRPRPVVATNYAEDHGQSGVSKRRSVSVKSRDADGNPLMSHAHSTPDMNETKPSILRTASSNGTRASRTRTDLPPLSSTSSAQL